MRRRSGTAPAYGLHSGERSPDLPESPLLTQGICDDRLFRIVCEICGATDTRVHAALPPHAHYENPQLDMEAAEDPNQRPYLWDLPERNCKCH